jgi:hypothetical protein
MLPTQLRNAKVRHKDGPIDHHETVEQETIDGSPAKSKEYGDYYKVGEWKQKGKKIGPAEDKDRRIYLVLDHEGMDTIVKKKTAQG